MKVDLERTYPMPVPPEVAWRFLQNLESVAACMPGAKLTGQIDDTHYKGEVKARVGPATLAFSGTIEVLEVDLEKMSLRLIGKGSDRSGSSGAGMDLIARIEPTEDGNSNLVGNSAVTMSGKAATFGGRMIVPVADQILKQFAANFAKNVSHLLTDTQPGQSPAVQDAGETTASVSETQLNGVALMWAVIKDGLRRLFGKKDS